MSYIRPLSNPEELYIFGSRAGLEIYYGKAESLTIPQQDWDEFCYRYVDEFQDELEHKGISIREEKIGNDYKTVLSYNGVEIPMWDVTWAYIIRRYEFEWRKNNERVS